MKIQKLREKAYTTLKANDAGGFTVPTRNGLYPAQWNWDSAFSAGALALMDNTERAWQEVTMLLNAQWKDGMVPHIVFHINDDSYFPNSSVWQAGEAIPSSGISQPPVLATFVRMMVDYACKHGDTENAVRHARSVFPALLRSHRWWHTIRNYQGLVKIIHPWESGFDNNQAFEEGLRNVPLNKLEPYQRKDITHAAQEQRPHDIDYDGYIALLQFFRRRKYNNVYIADRSPFQLTDVGVNGMLLRADYDLAALAELTHNTQTLAEIERWITISTKAIHSMLWSNECSMYCPIDLIMQKHIRMPSVSGLVPLFGLRDIPLHKLTAMTKLIEQWLSAVPYGFPSFDPAHPLFEAKRYCRGSAWPVWSWLVAEGLIRSKHPELAERIYQRTIELISTHGFYEYYNPFTGEGCGGTQFSWTAAMVILITQHMQNEPPA